MAFTRSSRSSGEDADLVLGSDTARKLTGNMFACNFTANGARTAPERGLQAASVAGRSLTKRLACGLPNGEAARTPRAIEQFFIDIHSSAMYKTAMLAKDMVAASAKPLLLSILAGGESYGYEIIQKVRALSGGQIEWSDGMLYPVLHRLERDGLIDSEWKEADTGRQRKYYFISSDGRKVLKTERQQWLTVHNTLSKLWKIKPVTI